MCQPGRSGANKVKIWINMNINRWDEKQTTEKFVKNNPEAQSWFQSLLCGVIIFSLGLLRFRSCGSEWWVQWWTGHLWRYKGVKMDGWRESWGSFGRFLAQVWDGLKSLLRDFSEFHKLIRKIRRENLHLYQVPQQHQGSRREMSDKLFMHFFNLDLKARVGRKKLEKSRGRRFFYAWLR